MKKLIRVEYVRVAIVFAVLVIFPFAWKVFQLGPAPDPSLLSNPGFPFIGTFIFLLGWAVAYLGDAAAELIGISGTLKGGDATKRSAALENKST